uniref:Uncharacterized protein n=1 Tax=Arundo donax TaxID=35708 RepID=A0A0A9A7F0_ARUDO
MASISVAAGDLPGTGGIRSRIEDDVSSPPFLVSPSGVWEGQWRRFWAVARSLLQPPAGEEEMNGICGLAVVCAFFLVGFEVQ